MFLRYVNVFPDFFGHAGKLFDKKAKNNFKIHESTRKQVIALHILPNISRNKGNQTMTLGQLIEDLFLFFKKALCEVKVRDQHLSFNIFWFPI